MSAVIFGSDEANKALINDLYRQMNVLVAALDGEYDVLSNNERAETEALLKKTGAVAHLWLCVSIRRRGGEPLPLSGAVMTLESKGEI